MGAYLIIHNHHTLSYLSSFMMTLAFYYLPWQGLMGYSLCSDLSMRISPNDSFLGTYYFWWTNLLYLPLFFALLLMLVASLTSQWPARHALLLTLPLLCLYPAELWDYLVSNAYLGASIYHTYGSNSLLTNTLNSYHPLVFYTSAVSLIMLLLNTLVLPTAGLQFLKSNFLGTVRYPAWSSLVTNLVALWMGSWWAVQEGTWGGWWNWDSSETFGLMVSLSLATLLHSTFSTSQYTFFVSKVRMLSYSFILGYFFIQLNFELVSHNFGAKFFFFFNNNLFFLECAAALMVAVGLLLISLGLLVSESSLYSGNWVSFPRQDSYTTLSRLTAVTLMSGWVVFSYKPLLSYFLWNFLQINVFNAESSLQYINSLLWLLGSTWLVLFSSQALSWVLLPLIAISNWKLVLFIFLMPSSNYSIVHISIYALLALNLTLFDVTLHSWITEDLYSYALSSSNIATLAFTSNTLDNLAIEQTEFWYQGGSVVNNSWNLSTLTNVPILNFFSLLAVNDLFQNFYELSSTYLTVYFCMELPQLPQLNLLFLLLVLLTCAQAYSNPKTRML